LENLVEELRLLRILFKDLKGVVQTHKDVNLQVAQGYMEWMETSVDEHQATMKKVEEISGVLAVKLT